MRERPNADYARRRMTVRSYLPGDESCFTARPDFAEARGREGGLLPEGRKWTLSEGHGPRTKVLGVAGLEYLGQGRWAAWAYLSALRPRDWPFLIASARMVFDREAFARSIVAIPAPTPEAGRVLKRIGFVEVGEPYMVWEG